MGDHLKARRRRVAITYLAFMISFQSEISADRNQEMAAASSTSVKRAHMKRSKLIKASVRSSLLQRSFLVKENKSAGPIWVNIILKETKTKKFKRSNESTPGPRIGRTASSLSLLGCSFSSLTPARMSSASRTLSSRKSSAQAWMTSSASLWSKSGLKEF